MEKVINQSADDLFIVLPALWNQASSVFLLVFNCQRQPNKNALLHNHLLGDNLSFDSLAAENVDTLLQGA